MGVMIPNKVARFLWPTVYIDTDTYICDNLPSLSCVDRQLVFNHRQSLAEQLRQETDAAMALHLATVLLIHIHTQCMVHAPGRCVPQLIAFLKQYLPVDHYSTLLRSQGAHLYISEKVLYTSQKSYNSLSQKIKCFIL